MGSKSTPLRRRKTQLHRNGIAGGGGGRSNKSLTLASCTGGTTWCAARCLSCCQWSEFLGLQNGEKLIQFYVNFLYNCSLPQISRKIFIVLSLCSYDHSKDNLISVIIEGCCDTWVGSLSSESSQLLVNMGFVFFFFIYMMFGINWYTLH